MKDKPFLVLSGLFFMLFVAGMMLYALPDSTTILRAKNAAVSPLKSFVIVFPQVASAGENVKVTVILRDVNGSVLSNRAVQMSADSPAVTITPSATQNTNENGQAQFFVTSPTAGKIQLKAIELASNSTIVNIPSVEFTQ